jgi:pimeloyl-ACP methyl ester carboxylesterase
MPVLVLTGQKAAGSFTIDQVRTAAVNVHGEVIEGSGHWLMSEAPERTMNALVTFLTAGDAR